MALQRSLFCFLRRNEISSRDEKDKKMLSRKNT